MISLKALTLAGLLAATMLSGGPNRLTLVLAEDGRIIDAAWD